MHRDTWIGSVTKHPGPLLQGSLLKQLLPHVVDEPGAPAEYLSGLKYALVRRPMDCSVGPPPTAALLQYTGLV